MAIRKHSNNYSQYINGALSTSSTTIQLTSVNGLPQIGNGYVVRFTLQASGIVEIVEATSISGNVITVSRGLEGTTAQAWPDGSGISIRVTAGSIDDPIDISKINATGTPSDTTYLRGDGSWSTVSGGGSTPGGMTNSVQINDGLGGFRGSDTLLAFNGYLVAGNTDSTPGFLAATNGGFGAIAIGVSESLNNQITYKLGTDGTNGQVLTTDGNGNLTFTTVSSGGGGSGTVSNGSINQLAYYAANGTTVSGLATANNTVLVTDGNGVPSFSAMMPNVAYGTPTSINLSNGTALPIGAGTAGNLALNRLATTGTASGTTYLRGDGVWSALTTSVTSVAGTANRITSSGGTTPSIDIASTYVGQGSITTLGTITTGTWQATTLAVAYGGTGTTTSTGTGSLVLANSPTLVTPNLGTPSALTLTNATGLPIANTTGTIGLDRLSATGTKDATTYLRGDNTWATVSAGTSGVATVSGTNNRITSTGGTNPVIDIANTYVGQTSITTVGEITSGAWSGNTIAVNRGGTGVTTSTGSGNLVLSNSPSLTTPNLGTPSAANLVNATNLNINTGTTGTLSVVNGGTGTTTSTGSGAVVLANSPALLTPTMTGVTNGSNAAAGIVGQYLSSTITYASSFPITSGVIVNVTSLSLTAGDWYIIGNVGLIGNSATEYFSWYAWCSTTSATYPQPELYSAFNSGGANTFKPQGNTFWDSNTPVLRLSLTATTTVYLSASSNFINSGSNIFGKLQAWRMR